MSSAALGPTSRSTGIREPSRARIRSIRRLTGRKGRRESGHFLAEGRQAVREALAYARVAGLWVDTSRVDEHADLLATAGEVPVWGLTATELADVTDTVTPQGILAEVAAVDAELTPVLAAHPNLVVVCARIRDPGNLGAVLRCADAFGADAVICTTDSVELGNPKVVRASVGSVFHLPVVTGQDLPTLVEDLHHAGLQVLAADGSGVDLRRISREGGLSRPTAWVMGNEAWGLPEADAALADALVAVPLRGRAESLNLATAAAVCLYETSTAQRGE